MQYMDTKQSIKDGFGKGPLDGSVNHPTSAQVMISWFMGLSPTLGSVLTARSLDPALDSVPPCLSGPPLLALCLSFSKINKTLKKIKTMF